MTAVTDLDVKQRVDALALACIEAKAMIAGAESCTGGLIAAAITAKSGSSAWFDGCFVTYSNAAKEAMLGVSAATLHAHGAVSEACAAEMAAGALKRSQASVAYAVTGIAGPTGGTAQKPVGLVCFGYATRNAVRTETLRFSGDRNAVRSQSVLHVLETLVELVKE